MNTGGPASEKTLRDEFAGQAMLAITISALSENTRTGYSIGNPRFLECLSIDAYAHADAMLAEKARREATGKDSLQVPDHSPDAGKMAELEAANTMLKREIERLRTELCETVDSWAKLKIANSELVEALEGCLENLERWCPVKHREARAILSKHKGVA